MFARSTTFGVFASLAVACSVQTTPPTTGTPAASATTPADSTSPPSGETPPKTTAYTEAEVQELFDARCVKCHDARSANVDLSAPFTKNTVGVPTGGTSGKTLCGRGSAIAMRIQPGDRAKSLLWHKVKGTQDCGSPMPYDRGNKPLDATELERLGLYIDGLGK
jgi:hypothetical protein